MYFNNETGTQSESLFASDVPTVEHLEEVYLLKITSEVYADFLVCRCRH